jgi:hypothetical protein
MVSIIGEFLLIGIAGLTNFGDVQEEAIAHIRKIHSPFLFWVNRCQKDLVEVVAVCADVYTSQVMTLVESSCNYSVHWALSCLIFGVVSFWKASRQISWEGRW